MRDGRQQRDGGHRGNFPTRTDKHGS
jgi:hypothetical protein